MADQIKVKGARVHNLKNLDIDIPKNQMVVITGLSGSGKSSLAFDTIYAEGQRRYVESLSAYARQFLGLMEKPDVDYIEGLSPAISIDQKSSSRNPRSTVGTVTEVYDYLRLLYARIGDPHCYNCGRTVKAQTVQDIVDAIFEFPIDKSSEVKLILLAPIVKARKGTYEELFTSFLAKGFSRARVNGEVISLEDEIDLDRYKKHNIELVIDRLVLKKESKSDSEYLKRVTDSVERGLNIGEGEIIAMKVMGKESEDTLFSEKFACSYCGISFSEIEPHTFSFNSPYGACPACNGLGMVREIDPSLIYNPRLSITEGGIYPWSRNVDVNSWRLSVIKSVAERYDFDIRKPIGKLPEEILQIILYGAGKEKLSVEYSNNHGNYVKYTTKYEGVIPNLTRRYKETDSEFMRTEIEKYMRDIPCSVCLGKKLKPEALAVTIANKNIDDLVNLSIKDAYGWLESISSDKKALTEQKIEIARILFKEILTRLNFLNSVGLDYLTLSRTARTLSGGEAQRIRLASQIGTGLTGVLYVLDEPSIGLHQRDNKRLLNSLENLKKLGNSVLVVEHDEDTIRNSDWIIDLGPGAGEHGGELVAEGTPEEIIKSKKSVTGEYLSGRKIVGEDFIKEKSTKRGNNKNLIIKNASEHNLKHINVNIPLGKLVCITGVSGSGKSTLINDILYKSLSNYFYKSRKKPGKHDEILGLENIDKVINIDQSPIGRTPRSNPATYTGLFTHIRDIFAQTPEAKSRGYKPGRFSFNVRGGRCENCKGDGVIKIEMQFLPDVYVDCEVCKGTRYNRESLQVDYKGKSIAQVLDMTVSEALEFFDKIPAIKKKLQTLDEVGLGYIRLGQRATTLSGGEAQRIKLALELSKRSTGKTLYILDEPTTGLHFADIDKLLQVIHSLVDMGNSMIIIEHNLDIVKTADWIIDLGPEGGAEGGEIVFEGTVEDIMQSHKSHTGEWLKKYIKQAA